MIGQLVAGALGSQALASAAMAQTPATEARRCPTPSSPMLQARSAAISD